MFMTYIYRTLIILMVDYILDQIVNLFAMTHEQLN